MNAVACLCFFYQFFIKGSLVIERLLGYDTVRKDEGAYP